MEGTAASSRQLKDIKQGRRISGRDQFAHRNLASDERKCVRIGYDIC